MDLTTLLLSPFIVAAWCTAFLVAFIIVLGAIGYVVLRVGGLYEDLDWRIKTQRYEKLEAAERRRRELKKTGGSV